MKHSIEREHACRIQEHAASCTAPVPVSGSNEIQGKLMLYLMTGTAEPERLLDPKKVADEVAELEAYTGDSMLPAKGIAGLKCGGMHRAEATVLGGSAGRLVKSNVAVMIAGLNTAERDVGAHTAMLSSVAACNAADSGVWVCRNNTLGRAVGAVLGFAPSPAMT